MITGVGTGGKAIEDDELVGERQTLLGDHDKICAAVEETGVSGSSTASLSYSSGRSS